MFKLFSREKTKGKTELRLSDVSNFIDVNIEKESAETERRVSSVLDDLDRDVNKLEGMLKELSSIKADDAFSNNIKNRYCERCLALFNFEMPSMDFGEINKFLERLENINRAANNLTVKEFKHMRFFKDRMGKISLQTKFIERKIKNLRDTIKDSALEKKERMEKCLTWIDEINQKIHEINNDINVMESEKRSIEQEIGRLASEVERFEKSGVQKKIDDELAEKGSIESQMNMLKQKIETEFGGILRPLKRLQYASMSGEAALMSDEKQMLEQYLQNSDTFLTSDKHLLIRNLLTQIKQLSDKGVIELNEKEKAKVQDVYSNLKFLITLKMQYSELLSHLREKEEKIKSAFMPLAEKNSMINNDISSKKEDAERLNSKIKVKNEEISRLQKKIGSNIFALEEMIKDSLNVEAKISY
jgi:predicted  nucleic acid-binding Zn-ribbon protein